MTELTGTDVPIYRTRPWRLRENSASSTPELQGLSELALKVCQARGLKDPAAIQKFLNPMLLDLKNPFSMKDMDLAVERVWKAQAGREKIRVFGDYDVDENDNLVATGPMIAYRGLFLMDKKGVVRHLLINDLPLGRNVDEALRVVDALQFNEENGEVCPANWTKGKEGMKESHESVANYLAKH